jgi:hypothetical protein
METDDTWLDNVPGDFERLSNLITEDLVKPTEALISLLYQSVSIRDSRHSIQLGVSSMCSHLVFAMIYQANPRSSVATELDYIYISTINVH